MRRFFELLSALVVLAPLDARVDLLLVPPESAVPETAIVLTLYLNNPTELDEEVFLPPQLGAEYASASGHRRVVLSLVNPSDVRRIVPAMSRVTLKLKLSEPVDADAGFVSLRLTQPAT